MNTTLTALETTVYLAIRDAAINATGGDFACLDEVAVKGLGRNALGGVVTSLETKGVISVDVTVFNQRISRYGRRFGGTRITQITPGPNAPDVTDYRWTTPVQEAR